tara:strand:- start:160 stop:510 length:351 start_codon:yes stop_codon:yes gene_type:complete
VINANFASENYETRVEPLDAWVKDGGKNSKDYIMVEAGDEFGSYIFNTRNPKKINWKFESIEATENFKGYHWENYELDFLIEYYLNCKYVDFNIKLGLFGLEVIESVIIEPKISSF